MFDEDSSSGSERTVDGGSPVIPRPPPTPEEVVELGSKRKRGAPKGTSKANNNSNKGRELIPWKKEKLDLVLFRLAIVEQVYIARKGLKCAEQWELFVDVLGKQAEFGIYKEQLTVACVRQYFESTMAKVCHTQRWLDENAMGTSNLSNLAGDLGELETLVRQIQLQIQEKKAEKELSKQLAKKLDKTAEDVLREKKVETAAEKRKNKKQIKYFTLDGSTTGNTSSSNDDRGIDSWWREFMNPAPLSKITKVEPEEDRVLQKMKETADKGSPLEFMFALNIELPSEAATNFCDVTPSVLIDFFSPVDQNAYVEHLSKLSFSYLHACKIAVAMKKMYMKTKEQMNSEDDDDIIHITPSNAHKD